MKNSRASSKGFKFQVGGNNIHKNQRLKKYDKLSIIIIITTLSWSWNILHAILHQMSEKVLPLFY